MATDFDVFARMHTQSEMFSAMRVACKYMVLQNIEQSSFTSCLHWQNTSCRCSAGVCPVLADYLRKREAK